MELFVNEPSSPRPQQKNIELGHAREARLKINTAKTQRNAMILYLMLRMYVN